VIFFIAKDLEIHTQLMIIDYKTQCIWIGLKENEDCLDLK